MAAVTLFRGAGFAGRGCGSARCRHGYISDRTRLAAAEWHPECHAGDKKLVHAGAHRAIHCITQFAMLVNQSVKFMPTGQGSLFMSITGASGHLVRETSIVGSGKVLQ